MISDVVMYTMAGPARANARNRFFSHSTMSMWVCAECGYSEVYVKDPERLRK